jgi:hypothetical protein
MKHTLQENMRRFGTKNLSEQTTQTNLTPDELAVLGLIDLALSSKPDVKNSTMDDLQSSFERNKKIGKLAQDLFNKKKSGTGIYDKNMFQIMLNVLNKMYTNQLDIDKLVKHAADINNISFISST